jgi:hypothetical protein
VALMPPKICSRNSTPMPTMPTATS